MKKPSRFVQFLVRLVLWIPLSAVTMLLVLYLAPIRKLYRYTTGIGGWGPSFLGTDFTYLCVCVMVSILYAIVGAIVSTIYTINSRKWWISIAILYAIYVIIMLLGLLCFSEEYFSQYGALFLDFLLGPPLFLGVIEGIYALRRRE